MTTIFEKISALDLAEHRDTFDSDTQRHDWQVLAREPVCYRYPAEEAWPGFAIGPIDLTLKRGEVVFLIGGNGSGKSTLARLLTGLNQPQSGCVQIDGRPLQEEDWKTYRQHFSAIYTDLHLFDHLMGPEGGVTRYDVGGGVAGCPWYAQQTRF